MKKLLIATLAVSLCACSAPDRAREALDDAGMTNIEITGYQLWGCGKGDDFTTGFVATNPNGKRVSGVVCSGLFKGSTIRYD